MIILLLIINYIQITDLCIVPWELFSLCCLLQFFFISSFCVNKANFSCCMNKAFLVICITYDWNFIVFDFVCFSLGFYPMLDRVQLLTNFLFLLSMFPSATIFICHYYYLLQFSLGINYTTPSLDSQLISTLFPVF